MEKYLGVKLVEAEPCSMDQFAGAKNKGDLSTLSGGVDQDGYKVVYEDGYTSWSPKDVFEKAYKKPKYYLDLVKVTNYWDKSIEPYKIRAEEEAIELNEKICKLDKFISDDPKFKNLDDEEQIRMSQQLIAMEYYLTILIERIENF